MIQIALREASCSLLCLGSLLLIAWQRILIAVGFVFVAVAWLVLSSLLLGFVGAEAQIAHDGQEGCCEACCGEAFEEG